MSRIDHSQSPDHRPGFWEPNTHTPEHWEPIPPATPETDRRPMTFLQACLWLAVFLLILFVLSFFWQFNPTDVINS